MRERKSFQLRADAGLHPTSAIAGRRGTIMYCAAVMFFTVSLQSGASTPTTEVSGTPCRYVTGSQSYDVRRSTKPAQSSPSSVAGVYFISRYALEAGDNSSFAPCLNARSALSLFHCCAIDVGRRRALPISSQPTIVLPFL